MSDTAFLTRRPIAHRGLHDLNKIRWENTVSAFEAAARAGYSIECDVRMTGDGVPVVFHDSELKRLTGLDGHLHEHTASQIRSFAIGGTADRVPSLDDMLDLVGGRVPLVIELKGTMGHDEGLVAAVGKRLGAYQGEAAIMSFDHWLVRRFRTDAPGVPGGLTAWGMKPADMEAHFSMLAHDVDFVSYAWDHLPNPFVAFFRNVLKRPVITWTVRDDAAVKATFAHADQMTFEGFLPELT